MVETLETSRLVLRKIATSDAKEVFENWASSEIVTKYLTWPPHASVEVSKSWILFEEESDRASWGIIIKETNQLIGNIGVVQDKQKIKTKTLGYVLGEKFWNQGYMSEALTKVIDYLFETTDVNRIEATHDIANPGSGRVMAKSGMTYEGVLRKAGLNNQGIVDMAVYSVLRSDRI